MQPPKMADSPAPHVATALTAPSEAHDARFYISFFVIVAAAIMLLGVWALARRHRRKNKS